MPKPVSIPPLKRGAAARLGAPNKAAFRAAEKIIAADGDWVTVEDISRSRIYYLTSGRMLAFCPAGAYEYRPYRGERQIRFVGRVVDDAELGLIVVSPTGEAAPHPSRRREIVEGSNARLMVGQAHYDDSVSAVLPRTFPAPPSALAPVSLD